MKKLLFSLAALVLLLISCQTQETDILDEAVTAPDIVASVETNPTTKTLINVDQQGEGRIYWTPADEINIFYGTLSTHYVSQNSENATTAVFRTTDVIGSTESASTNIWGLYPYDANATSTGSAISTTLPATQYGVPDTFDDDLYITLAHSTSTALKFYNVCGGIKFSLSRGDITSITFKGNNNEPLAGDISLTFENGLPKTTVVNGLTEITLTPKTGITFVQNTNYYIVALPGTLTGGFTMTFTTAGGAVGTFNYTSNPITIKRSIFSKKAEIDTFATFTEAQPNNVIYYTSTDGNKVTPSASDVFGANIISNEYLNGKGVITFDGDVTSIGDWAFYGCLNLSSIAIPGSVTSIGDRAFYVCRGLTSISIPGRLSSIGEAAFSICESLISIDIPEGVTSIREYTFSGCTTLASIVIPQSVTCIGDYAFSNCTSLDPIVIPEGVTSIGEAAFVECSSLTSITIPNSVMSIGKAAFARCGSLLSFFGRFASSDGLFLIDTGNLLAVACRAINGHLDIPQEVTRIEDNAFSGCTSMTSVTIPNSVTSIGIAAFGVCISLTSITIPSSVTSIEDYAFSTCFNLRYVTALPETPPSGGTKMFDSIFYIYVPAGSVDAYKNANGWKTYAGKIYAISE